MRKLTQEQIGKATINPIFKGLPKTLKDPKRYKKIEKQLLAILQSGHNHKKPSIWLKCQDCQIRFKERRNTIKKLGFKSLSQYLEWRKVMEVIIYKKNISL